MKTTSTPSGRIRFALTTIAAAAVGLAVPSAGALGLGRLAVQSALGESLRAEIDITSVTPDEAANLRVRVAPPEAYRSAGVDYNPVLPSTQAVLQRRPDGRSYVKVTSDRAVQEPFVDVILEVTWSGGRLVREFTLLFDPPSVARAASAPAAAPPVAAAAVTTSPVIGAAPANPVEAPPGRALAAQPSASPASAASVAQASRPAPAGPGSYRVRSGDTLSGIAARTLPAGVSLDQMLVSMYRDNPQAFVDKNMNRLRSGVVLNLPSAEVAQSTPLAEARQIIQAQSADFGAYRQRLAGAVPAARPEAEGSARQASGKVTGSVDEGKQAAATPPDKLTLSKGAAAASAAEERISREREREQAAVRVAELSKNVAELKGLKGAAAAAANAGSVPAPVSPQPVTPPPVTPTSATPPAAPAAVVALAAPPSAAATPAPPPTASAATPAAAGSGIGVAYTAPAAPPAPRSPAPSVPAAAASVTPGAPAAAADEPGPLAEFFQDNPLTAGLGGLALLLLAALGIYRYRQRPKLASGETSFLESRLQPDSFFGASGGQRIDTRDAGGASSSMSYSLSQLDAIGDVDPVAEADVYLAYGRDLQAEEILKEAMRSAPERMAIRTKLLEVYAKRRDTKGFELLATQLFAMTGGVGEDWAKAQELGAQIDPENSLFQPGGAPLGPNIGDRAVEAFGANTMPQSELPALQALESGDPAAGRSPFDPARDGFAGLDLDLDLDLDGPAASPDRSNSQLESTRPFAAPSALPVAPIRPDQPATVDSMSLDFDIPELTPSRSGPASVSPPVPADFDFGELSLDLDLPDRPTAAPAVPASVSGPDLSPFADSGLPALDDPDEDPMLRKLELAEEFRQIGDADGARDLLEEVMANASGPVKTRARSMLDEIG